MRYSFLSNSRSQGVALILLGLLATFSISCEKGSDSILPPVVPPSELRHATFPLAFGNEWAYVDSTFDGSFGPSLITMKISAYAAGWWNIDRSRGGSFGLMSRNDTILFIAPFEPSPTIKYIPNPPIGDTVILPSKVRVYMLAQPVTTPAGTFDSCAAYEFYLTPRNKEVSYFRPGTGLIGWESYYGEDTLRAYQRAKLVFLKLTE